VPTQSDNRARRLLPRWRYSGNTVVNAEYAGDGPASISSLPSVREPTATIDAWKSEPSLSVAIELVQHAIVVGPCPEAIEAARLVISQRRHVQRLQLDVAKQVLRGDVPSLRIERQDGMVLDMPGPDNAISIIREARAALRVAPRTVIRWLDMGRAYMVLGQRDRANQAMQRALALAPNHRISLRAGARFLVHDGRADEAWDLLRRHARTPLDPWLLALEISLADINGGTSRMIGVGRRLVDERKDCPASISELASAIGTVDWQAGEFRHGRRLIRLGLMQPTDNALAQAHWFAVREPGILGDISPGDLQQKGAMEARFHAAVRDSRWDEALVEAVGWLHDEPFSSRPALSGSFIAMSLQPRADLAAQIARVGLRADPGDQRLRNNLVVALVGSGDIENALWEFEQIHQPLSPDYEPCVYLATAGLLAYATGSVDLGRSLYSRALAAAKVSGLRPQVALAWFEAEVTYAPKPDAATLAPLRAEWEARAKIDNIVAAMAMKFPNNDVRLQPPFSAPRIDLPLPQERRLILDLPESELARLPDFRILPQRN
jgi:hypothetical protein